MFSILTLGFLMGMQHALEADHLAAVSSIASEEKCAHRIVRHGVAWGVGHSITLFGLAGAAILLRESIRAVSEQIGLGRARPYPIDTVGHRLLTPNVLISKSAGAFRISTDSDRRPAP